MKKINKKFIINFFSILALGTSLLFFYCSGNSLKNKMKKYDKQSFSCADYLGFKKFVDDNKNSREFLQFFNDGTLDETKVQKFLKNQDIILPTCNKNNIAINKISVYLENSGSIDGYVRGITDYESAIADLVVEAQYRYGKDKLHINFINKDIYPVEINNITAFFESLDPANSPYNTGNRTVSELNEIFEIILENTSKDAISVFISDCIYSLDKSRSTLQGLNFQQSLTKSVFLNKSRDFPISAYVLQLFSSFNGKYFDRENKFTLIENQRRPYYIWILGNDDLIRDFLNKSNPSKYRGFKNSYYFTQNSISNIKYEILGSTYNKGRFSFDRKDQRNIKNINLIDGEFQFSIAVDFKDYPDQNTLLNKSSYTLTPGFQITDIKSIPNNNQPLLINKNDWNKISSKGYSHILIVNTKDVNFPSNFNIEFTNSFPSWVSQSSTDDDTDIIKTMDKTFGLKYLFEGIQGAFQVIEDLDNNKIHLTLNRD